MEVQKVEEAVAGAMDKVEAMDKPSTTTIYDLMDGTSFGKTVLMAAMVDSRIRSTPESEAAAPLPYCPPPPPPSASTTLLPSASSALLPSPALLPSATSAEVAHSTSMEVEKVEEAVAGAMDKVEYDLLPPTALTTAESAMLERIGLEGVEEPPMHSFHRYVEACLEGRDVPGVDSSKHELLFFRRRQGDICTGLVMVTRHKPTGPSGTTERTSGTSFELWRCASEGPRGSGAGALLHLHLCRALVKYAEEHCNCQESDRLSMVLPLKSCTWRAGEFYRKMGWKYTRDVSHRERDISSDDVGGCMKLDLRNVAAWEHYWKTRNTSEAEALGEELARPAVQQGCSTFEMQRQAEVLRQPTLLPSASTTLLPSASSALLPSPALLPSTTSAEVAHSTSMEAAEAAEATDQAYPRWRMSILECPTPPDPNTMELDEFRDQCAAMFQWLNANQPYEDETVDPDYIVASSGGATDDDAAAEPAAEPDEADGAADGDAEATDEEAKEKVEKVEMQRQAEVLLQPTLPL